MSDPALPTGKLPGRLLAELLDGLPADDRSVRLGPRLGEDAAAIDVPAGTLVATTDPITLTSSAAGRYAVLVNANDVAVCGAAPRWFLATVLLPPGTTEAEVRALFDELTATLAEVGASPVGGHTEITPAVCEPVVVGQMLGLARDGHLVRSAGVEPGHLLVQVGLVPVEGAAVLAAEAGDALQQVPADQLAAAAGAIDEPGIGVVDAALLAAALGATAMHDPTEGGIAAGMHELAAASGVILEVDGDAIRWFEPGLTVCRALDCDPWATLASGCLLAAFAPDRVDRAVDELRADGQPVAVIGRAAAGGPGVTVDGRPLPWPDRDELARRLG